MGIHVIKIQFQLKLLVSPQFRDMLRFPVECSLEKILPIHVTPCLLRARAEVPAALLREARANALAVQHQSRARRWQWACGKPYKRLCSRYLYEFKLQSLWLVPLTEASILVRLTVTWNPGPRFCSLNLWISFYKGNILYNHVSPSWKLQWHFVRKHDELHTGRFIKINWACCSKCLIYIGGCKSCWNQRGISHQRCPFARAVLENDIGIL